MDTTTDPTIKQAVKAAFPEYRGRKIRVRAWYRPIHPQMYWDGGTKDEVRLVSTHGIGIPTVGSSNPFLASTHEPLRPEDYPNTAAIILTHFGNSQWVTVWLPARKEIEA